MNRGVVQSSPVQQMMASNPNWWNINNMRPPSPQPPPLFSSPSNFLNPNYAPTSSFLPFSSWHETHQELPEPWSQQLMYLSLSLSLSTIFFLRDNNHY